MMGHGSMQRTSAHRELDEHEKRISRLERRYDPDADLFIDESCLPPPGSLVKPAYRNTGTDAPRFDVVHFPGGVIAARLGEFVTANFGSRERLGPSRNAVPVPADNATDFDSATDAEWQFRPIEDFGLLPGVLYGIWFSFRYVGSGELAIESRSSNTVGDPDTWVNGGGRHPNASTTPDTLPWADQTDQTAEYPRLAYYGMFPVGGQNAYGDWPLQGGGSSGLMFQPGEVITVRAFAPDGDSIDVYLDHLVFMPTFPLGMTEKAELDTGAANFSSVGQEVLGYYVASGQPASVTEPTDYGSIFGGASAVDDDQSLRMFWDAAGHFTIAFHDESDAAGLFTGVGGVHVYVLCRAHDSDGTYELGMGVSAHVTCFTGSMPLADILCDEGGGWCWAYAGKMPLGDGPQRQFGMMQWVADGENFPAPGGLPDKADSVRTAFVAYLPQAPCEAAPEVPREGDFDD